MLFFNDGLRMPSQNNFSLFWVVFYVMITLCQPNAEGCIYQKYFQTALNETYATVYASMGIQSYLDCEQICLKHGFICVGANVYASGRHHVCSLFSEIRTPIGEDMLINNRNGKLIVKTKGLCKDGFTWRFRNSSYCFHNSRLNQADAMVYCKSIGAQLTTIETMDELEDIRGKLTSEGTGNAWTSAKQDGNNAVFRWASGMELANNSKTWASGEPSGPSGPGQCVHMWKHANYALDDIPCISKVAVLCEL